MLGDPEAQRGSCCCPWSLSTSVVLLIVDASALSVLFFLGKKITVEKVYTLFKPSTLEG